MIKKNLTKLPIITGDPPDLIQSIHDNASKYRDFSPPEEMIPPPMNPERLKQLCRPDMVSPVKQFIKQFHACTACFLCERSTHHVLYRGRIPADVLFVGEAPGISEDIVGLPFTGPAGDVIEKIVPLTEQHLGRKFRSCFTNVICCIPLVDYSTETRQPDKAEIDQCSARLLTFISIVHPKAIVCVGEVAHRTVKEYVTNFSITTMPQLSNERPHSYRVPFTNIKHPSWMLGKGGVRRDVNLEIKRAAIHIRDFLVPILGDPSDGDG